MEDVTEALLFLGALCWPSPLWGNTLLTETTSLVGGKGAHGSGVVGVSYSAHVEECPVREGSFECGAACIADQAGLPLLGARCAEL